ncbi:endonuclease domain-containing protein [Flexivirga caeni]|uniref:Restriction endonuclease type II-like domain-containing protein n=1 Tax=Flexivirga caeni TaxID=2294115 RepID=A0A3M9MC76_9MICO|nr:hypothetical protein [Flexivirga caeni]RNI22188.1 hypothetical protein EFY87_09415 [Flexivirga caeni]
MTAPIPIRRQLALPDLFTTEEAYAAGLTKRDLQRGEYRRLFRGTYVKAGARPTYIEQLAFAIRVIDGAQFAAQYSAARVFGGVTPLASNLHLGTRIRRHSKRDGVFLHFYKNPPNLLRYRGIHLTSPGQTFLDLARSLELVDLLVLGDSLVRREACSPTYLRNFVADVSAHGAQHAREAAALVRGKVYSPNESRLRLLMLSGGLPPPSINHMVYDESTGRKRELDLALPEWKVAVEFDGRHHIERIDQWERDILRREELEAMGWRFVLITSSAMYTQPLRVLERITDTIVAAGGPRVVIRDDWQRHFG